MWGIVGFHNLDPQSISVNLFFFNACTYGFNLMILETLRKYPPFPVLSRVSNEDYRIPNTDKTIERGIGVIIPVWAIHHDGKYFPNPEQFDPTRFENKIKPCNGTFLHFGDGPRMCMGSYSSEFY